MARGYGADDRVEGLVSKVIDWRIILDSGADDIYLFMSYAVFK